MCCKKYHLALLYISACIIALQQTTGIEICGGNDVTNDPRISSRQLDGIWYTHLGFNIAIQGPLSNAILFIQNQGQTEWLSDWNATSRTCSYRKFEDRQIQTLQNGPFTPCMLSKRALPNPEVVGKELFFFHPTPNLLMLYRCFGDVRADQSCSVKPFVRVVTRNLYITHAERAIIQNRLRQFGLTLRDLFPVDPRTNRCSIPMQK